MANKIRLAHIYLRELSTITRWTESTIVENRFPCGKFIVKKHLIHLILRHNCNELAKRQTWKANINIHQWQQYQTVGFNVGISV